MELTFTDEERFESFAYLYLLGQQSHRKGHRLELTGGFAVGVRLEPILGDTEDAADMAELYADHPEMFGSQPKVEAPAEDEGIVHEHIDLPPADETEQEAEKPKRKRRSKAEIAADEQAAWLAAQEPKAAEAAESKGNPNEPDAGPSNVESEQPPQSEADKHQASVESLEKHAAAQAEYTPELIETLKGQAELFDANRTAHLNEGREAIAKHGFIKYMATFKGLGLDSAIATYNDDQVKLHRAAIAHLMAA